MKGLLNSRKRLKRLAHTVLGLFLLSVFNMAFQVPLHAAMQQQGHDLASLANSSLVNSQPLNSQAMISESADVEVDHSNMEHCQFAMVQDISQDMSKNISRHISGMDSPATTSINDCHCPPALCDTVEAQQDQLNSQLSGLLELSVLPLFVVQFNIQPDHLQQMSGLLYQHQNWQYHQISPSPISRTTELQI